MKNILEFYSVEDLFISYFIIRGISGVELQEACMKAYVVFSYYSHSVLSFTTGSNYVIPVWY